MLVLSRRAGQSLLLGNDIKVHVLQINGNQVRIGLEAPKTVNIVRSELELKAVEKEHRSNGNARPLLTL